MSRNVLTYLLMYSLCFWAGCGPPSIEDKEKSLASVGEITIADVPLKAYLGQRIAFVLKNVQIEDPEANSGRLLATFKKGGGHGLACAVSEDGYFLTAFHVAGDAESLDLITGQDTKKVFPATVVWTSKKYKLAVVRSAARATPFHISTAVKNDSSCFCGGVNGGHSAGKILETWKRGDFHKILHSSPSVPGDSGGPLILEDGSLVGVNRSTFTQLTIGLLGVHVKRISEAARIDPERLEEIINEDRKRNDPASSSNSGSDLNTARIGGFQNAKEREEQFRPFSNPR
ncbi:MAG: trypsin-like peptidase domain-containing protein [Phycisphaerales bacterium]|nr:MAG: trypsin-like peptidase domain-containing protein [Phycisphaerales bacterium]